jgi:uncharacterized membrane protein (DUF4010 family)
MNQDSAIAGGTAGPAEAATATGLAIQPEQFLLVLGLSFFFGLAFEEFHRQSPLKPPGGIRTFPLLSLLGTGLYVVSPHYPLVLAVGALVLGAWLFLYYRIRLGGPPSETGDRDPGLVVPVSNFLAFMLGPIALVAPPWFAVAVAVSAVVLMTARERLHDFARRVPGHEIITLGKFLILTGIVLPLLPDRPVTPLTPITPYQAWLALITVSGLSYGSYLAQRYLPLRNGAVFTSVLGGLYSSTAATVVIARQLRSSPAGDRGLEAGIVFATAAMYLRVGVVIAIFNSALARELAVALAVLLLFGALIGASLLLKPAQKPGTPAAAIMAPTNPLELSTGALFAISFIIVSVAATWAKATLGQTGFFWLAGIVGITDIDPFVLSVAQSSAAEIEFKSLAMAILIAASSNNLLKAVYVLAFSRNRRALIPSLSLMALAAGGVAIAFWL